MILGRLLRVLGSRIGLVLAILGVTVAASAVGTLLSTKRYVATTSILLELPSKDPVLGGAVYLQGSINAYLAAQMELLGSERVIQRVIQRLALADDPVLRAQWSALGPARGPIEAWLAGRLAADLKTETGRDAPVIRVSVESRDPVLAARIANGFVQAYVEATLGMRAQPAREYAAMFEAQATDARRQLAEARERLSRFQQAAGITSSEENRDVESTRLQELSSQLVQLETAAAAGRSREATLRAGARDSMPEAVGNLALATIRGEIGRVRGRIEEQAARLGPSHPQMIALQAELADLNRRQEVELTRVGDSIAAEAAISAQRVARTRAALDAQRNAVLGLKQQRDQLSVLQRAVDDAQKAVDLVSQRFTQTSNEAKLPLSNVSVLSSAAPPGGPARPRPLINLALGAVLGLLLGLFAAIALERVQRPVRDAHDLLAAAGVPVLGMIGNARSVRPQRLIEGSATLPEVVPDAVDPEHRLLGPGPRRPAAT